MKRLLAFVLMLVCLFGMVGCRLYRPDFEDFQAYEDDFVAVKNFLVDYVACGNTAQLIIDINSQYLSIAGDAISDCTIEDSVKAIYDKGFTYIEMHDTYIIFWEDETGYYGVLWSRNPKESIKQIVQFSRPHMKSRKLSKEWYEVGALDAI